MSEKYYITPRQMKELEKRSDEAGVGYYRLMENAGSAAAAFILEKMHENNISGTVCILCGKGNNGGDGYVIARNFADAGLSVRCVMMCSDAGTDLAAKELGDMVAHGVIPVVLPADGKEAVRDIISDSAVIADCVFGTGFHGSLPDDIREIFEFAEKCPALKIAVDIPSGGNGLTGTAADGMLHCAYTVSMGVEKIGTAILPLREYCGEVTTVDIGIPRACTGSVSGLIRRVDIEFVKSVIPKRAYDSHKGTFGKLLNIAGSRTMPGAAVLSTAAALRSGAGLVKLAGVDSVVDTAAAGIHECTLLPLKAAPCGAIAYENADVLVSEMNRSTITAVGCGLSVCDDTKKLVKELIMRSEVPLLIDADGLNCIAPCIDIIRNAKGGAAVTPHPAELGRLLGIPTSEVTADRLGAAQRFNSLYETVILAKGVPTFVVGNDSAYVSFTGNAGLARGGSGDVLTGIAAGIMAMGVPAAEALACAAYIHGRAADRAAERLSQTGMLPSDVIAELPFVFREADR